MNCLIILLLLFCGGCRNNCGCNDCEGRERDEDRPCGEDRGEARHQRSSERGDRDCEQEEPAAWREGREGRHSSFPGISSCETCGCDPE